jgi:aldose 1-epimerase
LPWSNRIPGGEFAFEGQRLRVPVSWDDGSALHGLAARTAWTVAHCDETSVELVIDIDEGPYQVEGWQRFALQPTHLDQTLRVRNHGLRMPVGLGIHPWFRVAPVRVPADAAWPGEPMPTGAPLPVDAANDLREVRAVPEMDRCYTDLTESCVEVGELRLSWAGPVTQVVVFSGDPDFVCVEPVTMANDGFRLAEEGVEGHGVVALDPGQTLEVTYRFAW